MVCAALGPEGVTSSSMNAVSKWGRIGLTVLVTMVVFAGVVLALNFLIPGPHGPKDYLTIGTAATFAAMLTLFFFLIRTTARGTGIFVKEKRRRR